jgi:benzodiazapine receptor
MAVAAWRVWRRLGFGDARDALALFAIQLLLNLAWTNLFFGFRQIGLALVEIVVLFAAIVATAISFWRRDRGAGLLFIPYLGRLGFAALLDASLWRLNWTHGKTREATMRPACAALQIGKKPKL